jgi:hypothetical protein
MRGSIATAAIAALFLGGCAIHPLPEDVTRNNTLQIVHKIRCEGREALDRISVRLLRAEGDERAHAFADQVERRELTVPELFGNKKYKFGLSPRAQELFLAYTLSAVTFDFFFDIDETNDNSASAGFRLPFVDGIFNLNANAGAKFERGTARKFMVTSSFRELHELNPVECAKIVARVGNYYYPITGVIGLEEIFDTFVMIDSTVGGLPGAGNPHQFSDEVSFITTIGADVNPSLTLDAIPNRFRLVSASATLKAERVDKHQVTVALAKGDRLRGLDAGRVSAKDRSRAIAEQRRMEDLIIVPRRGSVIIQR